MNNGCRALYAIIGTILNANTEPKLFQKTRQKTDEIDEMRDCEDDEIYDAYKDVLVDSFLVEIGRRAAVSFVLEGTDIGSIKKIIQRAINFAAEL